MEDPDRPLALRCSRIATPEGLVDGVVVVMGGRIRAVRAADAPLPDGCEVVDLGDLVLLPAAVDTHVHVNEPGRGEWEGWASASRAAAAGGTATLVDMPLNSSPVTTTPQALAAKLEAARAGSIVDYGCWGGLVPGMDAAAIEALAASGVLGLKCFMCDSGLDEFPAVHEADLRAAMPVLARLRLPLLAHAEMAADAPPWHGDERSHAAWAATRPARMEHDAVRLLAALAAETGCRVHVVHVSDPDTPALGTAAGTTAAGQPLMTFETCPHYLLLDADSVPDGATAFKCAPPLRPSSSRRALCEWVVRERPAVVSDHSPAPPQMKAVDSGSFASAWGGIASLQLTLSATWTALCDLPGVDAALLATCCAQRPAELAGLTHVGRIAEGSDATLVAFDPDAHWTVDGERLHHRWALTPYHGMHLRGRVVTTWLRGQRIYVSDAADEFPATDAARPTLGTTTTNPPQVTA
jgi:allantoinase